ncbi:CobW family GTP-binding protein [Staphylococcus felis]|uniref:CobW family GTP-binding protein n=1 Tax=Staphylococcus felis TaxID=46127 RepID=UPI000E27EC46|nr:GTP-binding protein [Staphylococcus felis]REH76031.1 GTP-binding protein [Staphylococcus felis]REH95416.1 GTP-binding protein [Staphylococcus felis]REI05520.1 GTP-binding protein [Staphylococcus felis]REI34577.1 GTP-binding protein [Staphylococcus felis]
MDIVVLTGFLGSGKTSLLNALVRDVKSKQQKAAVIMNDFGHQNVDVHLVDEEVEVMPLTNGCVCCTLKEDLTAQLHEIYLEHQPDIVFVECSGVAHPVEVLDACLTPVLTPITTHVDILGILDAVSISDDRDYPEDIQQLMYAQLKYSSTILVNKIDLVDTTALLEVIDYVQHTFPNTPYQLTQYGDVTLDVMQHQSRHISGHEVAHHHSHLNHFIYEIETAIRQHALLECIKQLPGTVYRVKGFVNIEGYQQQCIVQFVPNQLDIKPAAMQLPSYIVVIGYQLDVVQLKEIFDEMVISS